MEFTANSALLDTSIPLKICSIVALCASGASIGALQTVRITSFAHVLLSKIVTGAFCDASVVQKQTKFRLAITSQTFAWSIACKARIVTVSSDSETTLCI